MHGKLAVGSVHYLLDSISFREKSALQRIQARLGNNVRIRILGNMQIILISNSVCQRLHLSFFPIKTLIRLKKRAYAIQKCKKY